MGEKPRCIIEKDCTASRVSEIMDMGYLPGPIVSSTERIEQGGRTIIEKTSLLYHFYLKKKEDAK
jgi:hypothetical protein